MTYVVQLSPLASNRLAALSDEVQDLFVNALARLAEEPHPPEARCVDVAHQVYARRVGDGLVIYRLFEHTRLILVTRLRWRVP